MKKLLLSLLSSLVCTHLLAASGIYNVRDFGAKGDGRTLDSPAINAAIQAAEGDGGGQVLLPAGTYLSGSIRLKSNIDLHLSAGCTILAAPASMKAYDESRLADSQSIRTAATPISTTRSSGPRGSTMSPSPATA